MVAVFQATAPHTQTVAVVVQVGQVATETDPMVATVVLAAQ
jgi:hypothetical protein